ncbi:transmembrane protein [Cystoisospora suis]|uniref:Transmembrane protein n=1 Tax=Cystoisospora suis TaxID=483139 RepID=A0A2C6KHQ3_9APIC|nr:transmembrane protein [Cystoisospora suis]
MEGPDTATPDAELRQTISVPAPRSEAEQGSVPFFSEALSPANLSPLLTPCSTPQYIPPIPDDISGWLKSLDAKVSWGAQSRLWLTRIALLLQGFVVTGLACCSDSLNLGVLSVLVLSVVSWGIIERRWWLPAASHHSPNSEAERQRHGGRFALHPCVTLTLLFELISPQAAIWGPALGTPESAGVAGWTMDATPKAVLTVRLVSSAICWLLSAALELPPADMFLITCIDVGLSVGTMASLRRYDVFSEDTVLAAASSAALFLVAVARCLPERREQRLGFPAKCRTSGRDVRHTVRGESLARPEKVSKTVRPSSQSSQAQVLSCGDCENRRETTAGEGSRLAPENYHTGRGTGQTDLADAATTRLSTQPVSGSRQTSLLAYPGESLWSSFQTRHFTHECLSRTISNQWGAGVSPEPPRSNAKRRRNELGSDRGTGNDSWEVLHTTQHGAAVRSDNAKSCWFCIQPVHPPTGGVEQLAREYAGETLNKHNPASEEFRAASAEAEIAAARVILRSAHALIVDSIGQCENIERKVLRGEAGTDGKQTHTRPLLSAAFSLFESDFQHLTGVLKFSEASLRGVMPLLEQCTFSEVSEGSRNAANNSVYLKAHLDGPLLRIHNPCRSEPAQIVKCHSCKRPSDACSLQQTSDTSTGGFSPTAHTDPHICGDVAALCPFRLRPHEQKPFDLLELLATFSTGSKVLACKVGCEAAVHVENQLILHASGHVSEFQSSSNAASAENSSGHDGMKLTARSTREKRPQRTSRMSRAGLSENIPTLLSGTSYSSSKVDAAVEEARCLSSEEKGHTNKPGTLTSDPEPAEAEPTKVAAESAGDSTSILCGRPGHRLDEELRLWVVGNGSELLVVLNMLFAALLEAVTPCTCVKLIVGAGQAKSEKGPLRDSGQLQEAPATLPDTESQGLLPIEPKEIGHGNTEDAATDASFEGKGPSPRVRITRQDRYRKFWLPVRFDFCLTVPEHTGSAASSPEHTPHGRGKHIDGPQSSPGDAGTAVMKVIQNCLSRQGAVGEGGVPFSLRTDSSGNCPPTVGGVSAAPSKKRSNQESELITLGVQSPWGHRREPRVVSKDADCRPVCPTSLQNSVHSLGCDAISRAGSSSENRLYPCDSSRDDGTDRSGCIHYLAKNRQTFVGRVPEKWRIAGRQAGEETSKLRSRMQAVETHIRLCRFIIENHLGGHMGISYFSAPSSWWVDGDASSLGTPRQIDVKDTEKRRSSDTTRTGVSVFFCVPLLRRDPVVGCDGEDRHKWPSAHAHGSVTEAGEAGTRPKGIGSPSEVFKNWEPLAGLTCSPSPSAKWPRKGVETGVAQNCGKGVHKLDNGGVVEQSQREIYDSTNLVVCRREDPFAGTGKASAPTTPDAIGRSLHSGHKRQQPGQVERDGDYAVAYKGDGTGASLPGRTTSFSEISSNSKTLNEERSTSATVPFDRISQRAVGQSGLGHGDSPRLAHPSAAPALESSHDGPMVHKLMRGQEEVTRRQKQRLDDREEEALTADLDRQQCVLRELQERLPAQEGNGAEVGKRSATREILLKAAAKNTSTRHRHCQSEQGADIGPQSCHGRKSPVVLGPLLVEPMVRPPEGFEGPWTASGIQGWENVQAPSRGVACSLPGGVEIFSAPEHCSSRISGNSNGTHQPSAAVPLWSMSALQGTRGGGSILLLDSRSLCSTTADEAASDCSLRRRFLSVDDDARSNTLMYSSSGVGTPPLFFGQDPLREKGGGNSNSRLGDTNTPAMDSQANLFPGSAPSVYRAEGPCPGSSAEGAALPCRARAFTVATENLFTLHGPRRCRQGLEGAKGSTVVTLNDMAGEERAVRRTLSAAEHWSASDSGAVRTGNTGHSGPLEGENVDFSPMNKHWCCGDGVISGAGATAASEDTGAAQGSTLVGQRGWSCSDRRSAGYSELVSTVAPLPSAHLETLGEESEECESFAGADHFPKDGAVPETDPRRGPLGEYLGIHGTRGAENPSTGSRLEAQRVSPRRRVVEESFTHSPELVAAAPENGSVEVGVHPSLTAGRRADPSSTGRSAKTPTGRSSQLGERDSYRLCAGEEGPLLDRNESEEVLNARLQHPGLTTLVQMYPIADPDKQTQYEDSTIEQLTQADSRGGGMSYGERRRDLDSAKIVLGKPNSEYLSLGLSPTSPHRPEPVVWHRQGGIGANGTPILVPRELGTCPVKPRKLPQKSYELRRAVLGGSERQSALRDAGLVRMTGPHGRYERSLTEFSNQPPGETYPEVGEQAQTRGTAHDKQQAGTDSQEGRLREGRHEKDLFETGKGHLKSLLESLAARRFPRATLGEHEVLHTPATEDDSRTSQTRAVGEGHELRVTLAGAESGQDDEEDMAKEEAFVLTKSLDAEGHDHVILATSKGYSPPRTLRHHVEARHGFGGAFVRPPVVWGRQGAIGGNGTPMIVPRKLIHAVAPDRSTSASLWNGAVGHPVVTSLYGTPMTTVRSLGRRAGSDGAFSGSDLVVDGRESGSPAQTSPWDSGPAVVRTDRKADTLKVQFPVGFHGTPMTEPRRLCRG